MDLNFIKTTLDLNINGNVFTLDVGEIKTVESAGALMNLGVAGTNGGEINQQIKAGIDEVLGEGAAGRIFKGQSSTNDLIHRHMAVAVASAVLTKRSDILMEAFSPSTKKEETPQAAASTDDGPIIQ